MQPSDDKKQVSQNLEVFLTFHENGFELLSKDGCHSGTDLPALLKDHLQDVQQIERYYDIFADVFSQLQDFLNPNEDSEQSVARGYRKSLCYRDGFANDLEGLTRAISICEDNLLSRVHLRSLPIFMNPAKPDIDSKRDLYLVVKEFEDFMVPQQLQIFTTTKTPERLRADMVDFNTSLFDMFTVYASEAVYLVEGIPHTMRKDNFRLLGVLSTQYARLKKSMIYSGASVYPVLSSKTRPTTEN